MEFNNNNETQDGIILVRVENVPNHKNLERI